jgi:hypothetical protein
MNGCIKTGEVPFQGGFKDQPGRYFHLMYRSIYSKPKDYSFAARFSDRGEPLGRACSDYVIGDKTYNEIRDLLRDEGVRGFDSSLGNKDSFCWVHPFFPLSNDLDFGSGRAEVTCHQYIFKQSHGFIALRVKEDDIYVGRALGNFTTDSGTVFDSRSPQGFLKQYAQDENCGHMQGEVQDQFRMFY